MQDRLDQYRPRMMAVAYRMLGSVTDAEDAVQDAFLRFQATDHVESPEGFLVKATTNRCLDQLRADRRHHAYIGPWNPEPIDTKVSSCELAESLSQAFLLMLELLSPDQRAAYLLRSVFDYEYAEIASVLDQSEASVRQMVSRARTQLLTKRPRFQPSQQQADSFAEKFIAACRSGEIHQIEELLTEDVEVRSDGGGKVSAARAVISGRDRAARFLSGVFNKFSKGLQLRSASVNGSPGVVFTSAGTVVSVVSLHIDEGIRAVYITVNPDKLTRWSAVEVD